MPINGNLAQCTTLVDFIFILDSSCHDLFLVKFLKNYKLVNLIFVVLFKSTSKRIYQLNLKRLSHPDFFRSFVDDNLVRWLAIWSYIQLVIGLNFGFLAAGRQLSIEASDQEDTGTECQGTLDEWPGMIVPVNGLTPLHRFQLWPRWHIRAWKICSGTNLMDRENCGGNGNEFRINLAGLLTNLRRWRDVYTPVGWYTWKIFVLSAAQVYRAETNGNFMTHLLKRISDFGFCVYIFQKCKRASGSRQPASGQMCWFGKLVN